MTGGKEQTADEKEKVSEQNADQTVENNDVVQLPKNEENSESGSENEDYPGEDVVEIVNLKGETTTVYKLADGRYMDRIERIFIFDGVDTWTDTNGQEHTETVTYEDNGFGTINDDDKKHLGQWSPKWSGGFTTTFTYKDWELSAFFYGRFGGTYFGLLQTLGRRVEKDLWSEDNPGGKYPIQYKGGTFSGVTDYSKYMSYTKGNMVA